MKSVRPQKKPLPFKRALALAAATVMTAASLLFLPGYSLAGEAKIRHDGKGSVTLEISSDAEKDVFETSLNDRIKNFCVASGDTDMLTVKSVKETEGGYSVGIEFRRIDKIKVNGQFNLDTFRAATAEGSMSAELLKKMDRGNLSCTVDAYYGGLLGKITIDRSSVHPVPSYRADGTEIGVEEILSLGQSSGGGMTMLKFRMFDVGDVSRVTVKLPGEIYYYGGDNIAVKDGSTVELVPSKIPATVQEMKYVTDGKGNEILEPETMRRDVNMLAGYLVYKNSVSPLEKGVIVAAAILFGTAAAAFVVFCVRRGKKVLERERREAEAGSTDFLEKK